VHGRPHFDGEERVGRGKAHVARERDVDAEAEDGAVQRGEDGHAAALRPRDRVLELADVLPEVQRVPRGIGEARAEAGGGGRHWGWR
jgi:hypothetical protein